MKIGVDITALAGGRGPGRYTQEIIKALVKHSVTNDVFYLYSPFEKTIEGLPNNFITKIIPLDKYKPWLNWTLSRQVIKDRIDVMFFPANDFWLWPQTRTVVALLDLAPATILKTLFDNPIDRMQNILQMKMLPRVASRIITISQYSSYTIGKLMPEVMNRVSVVYCGVSEIFQKSGIYSDQINNYILFVGGFDRRKNLENLLKAYKILLARSVKFKLILAGSAGKNKKLYYDMPELIKINGLEKSVSIVDIEDDRHLRRLYQQASLLVLPSIIEGFGLPVLEAMACGCPVVCSNAASLPEVGGEAAIYFDPCDINEIALKIEMVLSDEKLRKEMISKGLKQATKFSWDEAGKKVYQVIKEAAQSEY